MVTITVPAPAALLNSNDRLHRMTAAKITRAWRAAGYTAAQGQASLPTPCRVIAYVVKPRAGRYDPGNLYPTAKAVLDGFTDAGLWPDDSHEYVIGPDMRHGGKGPAALIIRIAEPDD